MKKRIQRKIVKGLEELCSILDEVYLPYRWEGHWEFGNGMLGCYYLNLASLSAELDERWDTGVWQKGPSASEED